MDSKTLREKFLKFFEKNNHKIIPSSSLVPSEEEQLAGKERVLFTSAGMQPLIPYLMGKPHPKGKRLANVQKCLRTDDIEQVGDAVHHTFFEMLGNWSLGDYWKDEAIRLSFEFLTQELEIPIEKLAISVFAGDKDVPKDEESANNWKNLGISEKRIAYLGKEANWWPTGEKSGPCGPDTEMFIWTGEREAPSEFDPKDSKWVEVWNDVFMQFNRKSDGNLEDLPQKNVDTGMGLERMLAVLNGKDNDYETDLFLPIISKLEGTSKSFNLKDARIVADHMKAAIFLINEGVEPSNKEQGYVLRRLLRRAAIKAFLMDKEKSDSQFFKSLVQSVMDIYPMYFGEIPAKVIEDKISIEIRKFRFTLEKGLRELNSNIVQYKKSDQAAQEASKVEIPFKGGFAFYMYESYGFPPELTLEELQKDPEIKSKLDINEYWEHFNKRFKEHQEESRKSSAGMFKGGLVDHSEVVTKYHTATHLLHQALRDVLGPEVFQKGSNITAERLRFDFSYGQKMTDEEIKKVEDIINQRIKEDLKVDHMIIPLDEAKGMNAIGLFDEKYADKVSLYGVGPGYKVDSSAKDQRDRAEYYSLEFCGGPHVEHTGVIGGIKIVKEEAVSSGMRRIRIVLR